MSILVKDTVPVYFQYCANAWVQGVFFKSGFELISGFELGQSTVEFLYKRGPFF